MAEDKKTTKATEEKKVEKTVESKTTETSNDKGARQNNRGSRNSRNNQRNDKRNSKKRVSPANRFLNSCRNPWMIISKKFVYPPVLPPLLPVWSAMRWI